MPDTARPGIPKRTTILLLAGAMLLLLLLLDALNAFNLTFLRPHSTAAIFVFTAITVLVFLVFLMLLVLLFRNILKQLADQQSRVLGYRLRSRMLIGAVLISFAPAFFMFFFSYLLMNRSIDRWFSQPVSDLREDSTRIALELSSYVASNARAEAASLAQSLQTTRVLSPQDSALALFRRHRVTLQGGFVIVYRDGEALANYQVPAPNGPVIVRAWMEDAGSTTAPAGEPLATTVMHAAGRSDQPVLVINGDEYALGSGETSDGGMVVAALPMPAGLSTTVGHIRAGAADYWMLYRQRRTLRATYLLLLLLLTVLVFFASTWLALYLSKQVTRPVEALADAMNEIAEGNYSQRVRIQATQELGELIRSFNHMAADLETSRALAESSSRQLSAANSRLEERRRELERILETMPNGVATLDRERRLLLVNHAFLELSGSANRHALLGAKLEEVFPDELAAELTLLERRAQRMGQAATEFELQSPAGKLSLSAAISSLHRPAEFTGGRPPDGPAAILVLEDVTEFLQAQRQAAWKEVAQRVAHEIRNPLTPISLSAERILRHVDRSAPESPAVIRRCSEVILGSVQSLRTLVDQFAALAQFPTAQPRSTDLNEVVESALTLFEGRLRGIRVERQFEHGLPPVMADPDALRRALANLIDNAAEAMQHSLFRVLTVGTCFATGRHMAELSIADTGPGLTAEMRERLFLPYFSTKQRGTGLGLAIAAKIVQEHQGAIRAEQNQPTGARFILELPFAEEETAEAAAGGVKDLA